MSGQNYPRLSIQEFGSQLLESCDLDPVYVVLHKLREQQIWELPQVHRWLVAYWCFYSCGFACWVSEFKGEQYWRRMMVAARNADEGSPIGRWPRGRERRHFRGDQGINAIAELSYQYPQPNQMVKAIAKQAPDYNQVSLQVQSHRGFGPWIGFKIADMLDRCLRVPVDFTEAAVFMFKDPVRAAIMYWNQGHGHELEEQPEAPFIKHQIIPGVVKELTKYFQEYLAPPLYDRPVGLQEVETILCKWKSHLHGHYPLNNDIKEISEGVEPWVARSSSAKQFLELMPH